MTSTWDLGGEDKYLWLNLEMFFPFVVTCLPYIQEKITFTGINFQHLCYSIVKRTLCGKDNSYNGSILLLPIKQVWLNINILNYFFLYRD